MIQVPTTQLDAVTDLRKTPDAATRDRWQPVPTTVAALILMATALYAGMVVDARQAALVMIGGALGLTLYHAGFGFTAAWRRFLLRGRGDGVLAQLLLLGLAVSAFFPLLALGEVFGQPLHGFVAPAGVAVAVGAFLFGIGMQLGGGCGSGTLYTVGGGSARMVVTLVFFIVGSVIATAHLPWWRSLPAPPAISLIDTWGWLPAMVVHVLVFASVAVLVHIIDRHRHGGAAEPPPRTAKGRLPTGAILLRGPWPLWLGAVVLAVLSAVTLVVVGRPWGITSAFALWGAQAMHAAGADLASWPAWSPVVLEMPLVLDINTMMNLGIMLGAMTAAGLAGRYAPSLTMTVGQAASAALGGVLLGYGARLAYGCNIGAFLGGVVSGSLHGWLWFGAALFGNLAGVWLRPRFRLTNA